MWLHQHKLLRKWLGGVGLFAISASFCPPAWASREIPKLSVTDKTEKSPKDGKKQPKEEEISADVFTGLGFDSMTPSDSKEFSDLARRARSGIERKALGSGLTGAQQRFYTASKDYYDQLLYLLAGVDALNNAKAELAKASNKYNTLAMDAAKLRGSIAGGADAAEKAADAVGFARVAEADKNIAQAVVDYSRAQLARLQKAFELVGVQRDIEEFTAAIEEMKAQLEAGNGASASVSKEGTAAVKSPEVKKPAIKGGTRFAGAALARLRSKASPAKGTAAGKALSEEERKQLEDALAELVGFRDIQQGRLPGLKTQLGPQAALVVAEQKALGEVGEAKAKKEKVLEGVSQDAADRRNAPTKSYETGPANAGISIGVHSYPLQRDTDLPQDFRLVFLEFGPYYDGFCKHAATGANLCRVGLNFLIPGGDTTSRAFAAGAVANFQAVYPLAVAQSGLNWFNLGGAAHLGVIGKTGGEIQLPSGVTQPLDGRVYGVFGADLIGNLRFSPYYSVDVGLGGSFFFNQGYSGGGVNVFARINIGFKRRASGNAPPAPVPAVDPGQKPAAPVAPDAAPAAPVQVVPAGATLNLTGLNLGL